MAALELQLPHNLQQALEARAAAHARSLEDEARALLEDALEPWSRLSEEEQLEQLSVLDDVHLWQVAKQQVALEQSERMQVLVERQQAEGLSPEERAEARHFQQYAARIMLLKAEAAVLLKRRGHEIDGLRISPDRHA